MSAIDDIKLASMIGRRDLIIYLGKPAISVRRRCGYRERRSFVPVTLKSKKSRFAIGLKLATP